MFRQDRVSEIEADFGQHADVDEAYRKLEGEIDEINQRLAVTIIKLLKRHGLKQGSLLDVGCGTAAIGKAAIRSFPELSYVGIEPSYRFHPQQESLQSRLQIFTSVEEGRLPERSQNAIIFNHTLEHVPKPLMFLKQYLKYLKVGGLVYVEVQNEQWKRWIALPMRLIRSRSTSIFSGHINFFTARSLACILKAAGLEIQHLRKGYIGDSPDQIRRLSGDPQVLATNKKIALAYYTCRFLKLDRLVDYGITLHAIARHTGTS